MMPVAKPRPSNEDRIKAALWFAERDFGVFPVWSTRAGGTCRCPAGGTCTSPGKHPITRDGFRDATRDPERITTFLSAGSEPNYGLVPPEGVFVWDVDTDDERDRLAALATQHGELPATLRQATAHGEHVFWRWPDGLPRPLKRMFGLVTRWGSGRQAGYVIGPRSVHASGAEYAPAEGAVFEIATLSEPWARAAITGESDQITIGGRPDPTTVGVGSRHDFLRDTARYYAGTVRDPDALFAAVWAANQKLPVPKTEEEVRRAIGDVLERFAPDPVEEDPETGRLRVVRDDELDILPPTALGDFPDPPAAAAFGGLIGECVEDLARGTDASLAGLLASFIAVCGAMVPARAYARGWQTSSPFLALVGESSIGRKGTAMHRALDAARLTFRTDHVNSVLLDGLASGEALVAALHERRTSTFNIGRPTVALVLEDEFATMLQSRSREGSTLDQRMRAAFDGSALSHRRREERQVVLPPYWLPALAAITPVELRAMLGATAARDGSANRWLYVPVVRRDIIPPDEPPILDGALSEALVEAHDHGKDREIGVEPGVSRAMSEYVEHVRRRASGVAADLLARIGTHATRIALIHAAVERSPVIKLEHLERAVALTEYARSGIRWVFGDTIGNRDADLLLRHLRERRSLRQHAITRHIIRDPIRRQGAIDELVRLGYASVVRVHTSGRGATELQVTAAAADASVPFVLQRPDGRNGRKSVKNPSAPFVHASYTPLRNVDTNLDESQLSEREPRSATDGRKVDESGTKAGRKVDESGTEGPVDRSTGETQPYAEATWIEPCRDYDNHRDHHRRLPAGWICEACSSEGED